MSTENSNNRTAYLRLNHPTQPGVFEVVTIQQTLPASTTVPTYNFNWEPGSQTITGNGTTSSGVTLTIDFSWDGPQDLVPANFGLNGVGTNDGNVTMTLPQIQYTSGAGFNTITSTFNRGTTGTSLFNVVFSYPGSGQTGQLGTGSILQPLELIFTSGSGPGGSTGGCHLAGTEILMSDGTTKLIEELVAGDIVASYGFNGLSQEEDAWTTWSTNNNDFVATAGTSEIKSIGVNQFNAYRKINTSVKDDHIRITYEHPVLVNRSGEIKYRSVRYLEAGDKLYYRYDNGTAGWVDFLSMETVQTEDVFTTYTLDVEVEDSYLANGLVAHNVIDGDDPTGPGDVTEKIEDYA